jgi:rSAM/selenodomain-associated transferase 1
MELPDRGCGRPGRIVLHPTDTLEKLVIVFIKEPIAGRVKTRMAETIGHHAAVELYRQWIGIVLDALQPVRSQATVVGYYDGAGPERFGNWSTRVDAWWPQSSGDLGHRLSAAFCRGHAAAKRVIAVGTDCLEIDAELIRESFRILSTFDVVLGPTKDGGYYLIGTRSVYQGLFDSVRWSCEYTLADQLDRCRALDCSVGVLPERRDIDTWDDWLAYRARTSRSTT